MKFVVLYLLGVSLIFCGSFAIAGGKKIDRETDVHFRGLKSSGHGFVACHPASIADFNKDGITTKAEARTWLALNRRKLLKRGN